MRYSKERKDAVLRRLLPPEDLSVVKVAKQEGICPSTIYKWRDEARSLGRLLPNSTELADKWDSAGKFAAVTQTLGLNQAEISAYCRENGIYPEQLETWKRTCLEANDFQIDDVVKLRQHYKEEQNQRKQLEKELRRKEKALAEAAALLVLQKKYNAMWEERE